MSRVAAQAREQKEAHPARYCPDRRCLWRIVTRDEVRPCQNHPHLMTPAVLAAAEAARVAAYAQ